MKEISPRQWRGGPQSSGSRIIRNMSRDSLPKSYHPWGLVAMSAAVVAGIIAAIVYAIGGGLLPSPAASSSVGSTTSGAAADPQSAAGSSSSSTSSSSSSSSSPPPVMAASLLDLPTVAEDTNDAADLDEEESTEVDGVMYARLLTYSCSLFCGGDSPQTREVALGRKFDSFEADFAVLDTATGRHRLDITLDGKRPKTYYAEPGEPAEIRVVVTGVSRMRIQFFSPGPLKSPLQAGADSAVGENGGGMPGSALADPLLLP